MGIEIITNQQDLFSIWKMHIDYISTDMCEINARASVGDFDVSKPQKGCENHKQIADAIALIFRIKATGSTDDTRQRRPNVFEMLFYSFHQHRRQVSKALQDVGRGLRCPPSKRRTLVKLPVGYHHRFSNQGFNWFFLARGGRFRERHLRRILTLPSSLPRDAASISQHLQAGLNTLERPDVPLFDRQTFSASRHPFALWGSKLPAALQAQRFYEFSGSFGMKLQSLLVSAYRCKRDPTPRYLLSTTPAPA